MPAKKLADDNKVMDVSRPGKGKIVGTSRPVVAPMVTSAASKEDVSMPAPDTETAAPLSPSAGKKIIQPLNIIKVEDTIDDGPTANDAAEATPIVVSVGTASKAEEAPVVDTAPSPVKEMQPAKAAPSVVAPAEPIPAENPTPEAETPAPVPKPAEPSPAQDETSDAAGVDALAEQVTAKKEAAKKAEEQAKRDAAIDELVKSKKYFVPIAHESVVSKSGKKKLVMLVLVILLAALAAAYVLIDMGKIGNGIALPYEFFKEEPAARDSVAELPVGTKQSDADDSNPVEKPDEQQAAAQDPGAATPEELARDEERKNELRNLQQKLETHFNDNNEYPAALIDLTPVPTTDETTGPGNDAYVYDVAADLQSYTLSANLENDKDRDADTGGSYVLNSVNQ